MIHKTHKKELTQNSVPNLGAHVGTDLVLRTNHLEQMFLTPFR